MPTLKHPPRDALPCEPGRFDLGGGEASLRIKTPFEPLREATDKEIDQRLAGLAEDQATRDRAVVERQRNQIDRALEAVRGIEDPKTREDILDGFGGALALNLFHPGGPDIAEEADRVAKIKQTKRALAGRYDKQTHKEGTMARELITQLCFLLWDQEPYIICQYAYIQITTRRIRADFLSLIKPSISTGSKWKEPSPRKTAEDVALSKRIKNHIGTAAREFRKKRKLDTLSE